MAATERFPSNLSERAMNKLGSIVRFHFLQSDTKDDAGFLDEVSRLRRIGLQVYGVAAILVPISLLLARSLAHGELPALPGASLYLGISVLGVTVFCLGRTEWSTNKAALIGWLAVFFTCGFLVWNVYVETALRPDLTRIFNLMFDIPTFQRP